MAHSLCIESNQLVLDLYALLRSIDSARWREGVERSARQQLNRVSERLDSILAANDRPRNDNRLARLYEGLHTLAKQIEELRPRADQSAARVREEWTTFHKRLAPTYGAIAASLDRLSAPVPSLRPTNYGRNFFHIASGLGCLALIQYVLDPAGLIIVSVSFAAFCWLMELLRIRFKGVTSTFMVFFGYIAHPHEYHKVNSSTWYASALALLALLTTPAAASLGVIILAASDPVAALIGRRFGRTPLWSGRTLEGSLAFVAAGTLASVAVLLFYYPAMGPGAVILTALAASTFGAATELSSRGLDDNFTIPLGAALGATIVLQALM